MAVADDEVVGVGNWVLSLFLAALPVIGLILLFVWGFGSSTPQSKKNWARAMLIWELIAIVATILLIVLGVLSIPTLQG